MRSLWASAALVGVLFLASSSAAWAEGPCAEHQYGLATGPVQAPLLEGGLGQARRLCARNEVAVGGGGLLVVDLPNFYGRLAAGLKVDGSWAFAANAELFASFEALHYESLITPLSSSTVGLGTLSVGTMWRFFERRAVGLGMHGKVVLPTAYPLYKNVWPLAMDMAFSARFSVHPNVQFHAQTGVLYSVGLGKGPALPRVGGMVTVGTELRASSSFSFVANMYTSFGYSAALDVVAPAFALRFADRKRFGFEVGATVPVAGRDRALVRVDLRASVLLGAFKEAPKGRYVPTVKFLEAEDVSITSSPEAAESALEAAAVPSEPAAVPSDPAEPAPAADDAEAPGPAPSKEAAEAASELADPAPEPAEAATDPSKSDSEVPEAAPDAEEPADAGTGTLSEEGT